MFANRKGSIGNRGKHTSHPSRKGRELRREFLRSRACVFECLEPRYLLALAEVACVPWRLDTPHETWSGASTVLKAVVKTDSAATYSWNFGDGSAPATGSLAVGTNYGVEATHAYTGTAGTPYFATLTVINATGATSDQYKIVMKDLSLQVQTNVAIDKGLWYFHKLMTRQTTSGQPTGYWSEGGYANHMTGAAVLAFENEGHRPDGNASQDPYVETVQRGLNYLFYHMYVTTIGTGPTWAQSPYGDPDTNDNGKAISVDGGRQIYEIGPVMMALAASATPTRIAMLGPVGVVGLTYKDILIDMVDMCAWGQTDSGNQRGGWQYSWNLGADNSATQWPVLGLEAAETAGWGIVIPGFVKPELERWLNYSRSSSGCWGYDRPNYIDDHAHAGAGIAGLSVIGYATSDSRIQGALTWLNTNWNANVYGTVFLNKYGTYAVMKGMRTANPEITTVGSHDWFAEFASSLINGTNTGNPSYYKQQDAGYWNSSSTWTSGYLGDSIWSLLTLMPSVVSAPPVADLRVTPLQGPPGQEFTYDGSHSYHLDPGRAIVQYTFTFGDGTTYTETAASAPDGAFDGRTTHTYPDTYEQIDALPGDKKDYNVSLTVTDNSIPAKTDMDSLTVTLSLVNHKPVANPGGPYIAYRYWDGSAYQGVPLTLNGTGSYDPDAGPPYYNHITAYDWELDAATPYDFNDGSTNSPTWSWNTLGTFPIGLRVTDAASPALTDTKWTTVEVRDGIPTTFVYRDRHINYSDTVGLETWLKTSTGTPLPGMSVKYFLDANQDNSFDPVDEYIGLAVTNADGMASLPYTAWLAPEFYPLRAEFDGSGPYLASSVQAPEFFLRVDRETTVVVYTGDTSSRTGQTVTLQAQLKDDDGNALSGKSLSFALGSQSAGAVTGAGGVGQADLALAQPQGPYAVESAFAGDMYYAAASDSDPFLINDPPTIVDIRGVWGSRTASILGRDILPWSQIRAIEIVFSDDVDVQQDDLLLAGQTTGAKTSTGFLYNSGTKTARWEFAALAIDWYMMTLDGDDDAGDGNVGVKDLLGGAYLDGGDYARRFGVLTGDYNGDGLVNSQDTGLISRKFGSLDVFADLDGDGDVDAADMRIASAMRGKRLPI